MGNESLNRSLTALYRAAKAVSNWDIPVSMDYEDAPDIKRDLRHLRDIVDLLEVTLPLDVLKGNKVD